jgi:DNA invertase Pin-like site-specific DNA recombinase
MKRAGLYLRVSTGEQTMENQLRDLFDAAQHHGWNVVAVFTDEGISGSKRRDKRPGFGRLCCAITRREIDIVAAWSVDRLGRSLQHLVTFLGEIQASGCDLYLHRQGLDTSTPAGRAMFQMAAVFGEFERAMNIERTKAGMARARRQGKRIGRPKLEEGLRSAITQRLAEGASPFAVARALGVDRKTVLKYAGHGGNATSANR